MLVVEVDNYLYASATEISSRFESFLEAQLRFHSPESCKFDIRGAHLSEDRSGSIMLQAKDVLTGVQAIKEDRIGKPERIAQQQRPK